MTKSVSGRCDTTTNPSQRGHKGGVQDTDTATDLRHTLQVLLEAGGNMAEAARRLHFHYNTLRYRIDKLSSIVGPFTTDARVRLDVQLALLVHAMRGVDERRKA